MREFGQVLRGEWTKFRSVRSTVWCVLAAVVLTVLLSSLAASATSTDANTAPRFVDEFSFVHQPLTGDGTVTARVASLAGGHEWAKAGLMIKDGAAQGSPYAAVMVTARHGVRLQSTFDTDVAGNAGTAPRWLRLTRTGSSVTGFESTDGRTWHEVGRRDVDRLPRVAEVGLFVASPLDVQTRKTGAGSNETAMIPTRSTAVFDQIAGDQLDPDAWQRTDVAPTVGPRLGEPGDADGTGQRFTVTGSGDVAGYGIESWIPPGDDDMVRNSLGGVQVGLMAVIALGVLFATSEYKTGTIRATLTASPRRGRVLAAKAVVLGGVVFLAGLVASAAAFVIAQPAMRANGYTPPAYPHLSLVDGPVLRAVVGTALFLALLAVFSLGIGAIRRRTVGALILVVVLVVVPQIVGPVVSLNAELWLGRLTPVAGLAIQQTRERFDSAIAPWAGLGVLSAYAVGAMVFAIVRLRGRDA
ncbi:MAG TPA: ABC transporter permease subunit [Actinophytocola sp.]|uniref:ABC transporter permease subunit n=1 Tax=Actinophytocola sp. TaxID=1872138 RepID=UPI002DBB9D5F|nr:ABC transporter permease subunit [Actinophytocola sp.]HEU5475271.1 ABC transporter permease subunit [Actinophytocola sp.]